MKINFKSTTTNESGTNVIEFKSKLNIIETNGTMNLEFIEPQNNVHNLIEVGNDFINIHTGPSSINLKLHTLVANNYQTISGFIHFNSYMRSLENNDDSIIIDYTLDQNGKEFGEFKIELLIDR